MTFDQIVLLAKNLILALDKDILGDDAQRAAALRNFITPNELLDMVASIAVWHEGANGAGTQVALLSKMVENYQVQLKNLAAQVSNSAARNELLALRNLSEDLVMSIRDHAPTLRDDPHVGKHLAALQAKILL